LVIAIILTASGYASDILGEYLGPIEYNGYIGFDYPEGENPINNIVFNVDSTIAGNLIILNVPSPWSHSYGGGTLTLSGGSLGPGGSLRVTVSLNRYFEDGEYPVSSVGTTTMGEVSQASGSLLVGELYLLNFLRLASAYRFPLAGLMVGLGFLELLSHRRKTMREARTSSPATVTDTKLGDCQELVDKCKKARDAAMAAEAEAQRAKQKADSANLDFEKAKNAIQEAQKNLGDAQKEPSDEDESWIEMDGRRITSEDLKLRKDASKALWDQYRQGDIDAKTLEKAWERLGDHEENALENAKKQAGEAEEKAQKAKEEAESARKKSDEAKALADKVCKEADDCLKALAKVPTKPTTGKKEDASEEEPETTEESEETRETTETTETYETTTETYETTTETYETTTETYETTRTTEETTTVQWELKDTKFFGPRLGESALKPKALEKPLKEQPSVEGASRSRREYRSALGGAWADFWGTHGGTQKMDK
jgi:hypothetical protein